jgi:hypothetical protein
MSNNLEGVEKVHLYCHCDGWVLFHPEAIPLFDEEIATTGGKNTGLAKTHN